MAQLLERDTAGSPLTSRLLANASRGTRSDRARRRRKLGMPIALQVVAMLGIGALVYSSAADWFATLRHNSEVSGYVEAVEELPQADRAEKLRVAHDYNSYMPQGVLRDPYSNATSGDELEGDRAYAAYEHVLRVSENRVIGELSYPRLNIGLPISHGTSNEVISGGVGHLYGSSLPVGGPSTHSVLTAHSGLLHAALFTPLPNAKLGDSFQVTVLGETHYYRVDSIETVLPDQTGSLRIVDGQDYVTLITCTPIGINSHRVLVRGVRVDAPSAAGSSVIDGDGRSAGFPWWALTFLGGSGAVAYLLFVPPRSAARTSRSAGTSTAHSQASTETEVAQ